MKYNFVTIEREYGSGGTGIGQRLARELGIAFYGREILESVAKRLDITVDRIQQYEESATGSLLYSIIMMSRMGSGSGDMLSGADHIYLQEQKEIQHLAKHGPAVFMGHCAAKALEQRQDVLKVFIHGDPADRKSRVESEYGIPAEKAEATMKKFDRKRANYYYANTHERWNDFRNYDIVLDSAALSPAACTAALRALLEV